MNPAKKLTAMLSLSVILGLFLMMSSSLAQEAAAPVEPAKWRRHCQREVKKEDWRGAGARAAVY
jgi:hypothetical protein